MSDEPGPAWAPAASATSGDRPLLSLALAAMMREVHAHSGAVYVLKPDEPVLEMAVMAGMPRAFAAPWERVGLSAPIPVADAARERRLVWVGGEQEMVRRYPRIYIPSAFGGSRTHAQQLIDAALMCGKRRLGVQKKSVDTHR